MVITNQQWQALLKGKQVKTIMPLERGNPLFFRRRELDKTNSLTFFKIYDKIYIENEKKVLTFSPCYVILLIESEGKHFKTRKEIIMAKITKNIVDADLRNRVFNWIFEDEKEIAISNSIQKVNDRQYGAILTDLNGVERYVRIGAIVAEQRDDMTATELMESEINAYKEKQADKKEKAEARARKAEADAKRREQKEKGE